MSSAKARKRRNCCTAGFCNRPIKPVRSAKPAATDTADKAEKMGAQVGLCPFAAEKSKEPGPCPQWQQQFFVRAARSSAQLQAGQQADGREDRGGQSHRKMGVLPENDIAEITD